MRLSLRAAEDKDLELMLAWRSIEKVHKGFYQQGYLGRSLISWEDHYRWWQSRKNWDVWIIRYGEGDSERDVGVVTTQYLDTESPEVGYYIGETTLWCKGVATEAVRKAIQWLKERGYKEVRTTVLKNNKASLRVVEKLGFECIGDARFGELAFRKSL